MRKARRIAGALFLSLSLGTASFLGHTSFAKGPPAEATKVTSQHPDWAGKPVEGAAARGLAWLASVQGKDGGFGQDGGDGSSPGGTDVANTAIAALAFLRGGSTPTSGKYRDHVARAVDYVLRHVEEAPADGLAVTSKQGTQIQTKLGPYIDTFLATLLLSEIDGQMGNQAAQARVRRALDKCVTKIEKNQAADGSWNAGGGWAPVIGTSMASRGLYNAKQKGARVDDKTLSKVDGYTKGNFDRDSGSFSAGAGGAGVELYQAAQALEQASRSPASRAEAAPMTAAAVDKIGRADFRQGFGSMGGEEFISYLNISDSMIRVGGAKWKKWNGEIKEHLVQLQNQDGTWAGHHCITGRVACTAAAVLTLLAERTAPRAA